jgi:hypothetical protein
MDSSGRVIEAQVDWLTVSAHSEERSRKLSDFADDLLTGEVAAGNHKTGWRSMGYEGFHSGHIDWGRRDDRQAILRVSGGPADALLVPALALADNCSRLDLCVTWRAAPPDPHIGANAYSLAFLFHQTHSRSARPEFQGDADGGYTCKVGNRRSPFHGRLYNKEAERASRLDADLAKHYQACWRYEVEAHDARALALATMVAERVERPAAIQQYLYDWWNTHGVPTAFPESGADALELGFHRRSDDETRLRHLERNVRPTIKRLRAHGREDDLRERLGFASGAKEIAELRELLARHRAILDSVGQAKPPEVNGGPLPS